MAAPRLTVIDVGHGNSALLQDVEGVVLIDTGPRNTVLELLREYRIKRIDLVLISHADEDHVSGLLALLASKAYSVGRVLMNTDSSKKSAVWDDLAYELSQLHAAGEVVFEPRLSVDATGTCDHGVVHVEILGPSGYLATKGPGSTDRANRALTSNSVSAVIRLSVDGEPVMLLAGDIDDVGLENLLETNESITAPVLVFPHHGGQCGRNMEEFAAKLCAHVKPNQVIFSLARSRLNNPQPEVVRGVRSAGANTWIACTQLSTRCAEHLPADEPRHLNPAFADGKRRNRCCAGTIVYDLDKMRRSVLPLYDEHQTFISENASTPLCRRRTLP